MLSFPDVWAQLTFFNSVLMIVTCQMIKHRDRGATALSPDTKGVRRAVTGEKSWAFPAGSDYILFNKK